MNKTLRYSAYVALLLGSTGIALANGRGSSGSDMVGQFTIGGGVLSYETTDEDSDADDLVLNGSAAVAVRLAPAWSVQFDVVGEQVAASHDDIDEQYHTSQAVGGHLTWRKPGTGSVGVFAGYGSSTATWDDVNYGAWIGVEGQLFFNDVTLYGQAGIINISDGDDEGMIDSANVVRGVGRYFFSNDMKVEVELARAETDNPQDNDDDYSADGVEWAISLQARLADAPIYGTVGYRGGEYTDEYEDEQADVDMLTVGVSFMFGTESLKANDRDGTSLDTPLIVTRTAAILGELEN
jgi:hypothetical protein